MLARRLIDRLGAGIVPAALVAITLGVMLVGLLTVLAGWRGLHLSAAEFLRIAAVAEAVVLGGFVAGFALAAPAIRPVYSWLKGGSSAIDPPAAWEAAVMLPHRIGLRVVAIIAPLHLVITTPFVVAEANLGPLGYLPIAVIVEGAVGLAWFLGVSGGEIVMRPIRQDIFMQLAEQPPGIARGPGIGARTFLPVPFVALLGAAVTAAVAVGIGDTSERLAVAVAVAAGVALGWLALFKLLITDPVLRPISDLTAATDRISAGDLSAPVPLTTTDELGQLATAFNRMQEGLRERERLSRRNSELIAELRASRRRIVGAQDAERRRIERDLHDGAQQRLVALAARLQLASDEPGSEPKSLSSAPEKLLSELQEAIVQLRDLARGIYPPLLQELGPAAALKAAARGAVVPAEVVASADLRRHPGEIEAALYFCCLEALQNTAKHAGRGVRAQVRMWEREEGLGFEVSDDGHGFEPAAASGGAGLANMRDRLGALGGTLEIDSQPGGGTRVRGTIPLGAGPD